MKRFLLATAATAFLSLLAPQSVQASTWDIDASHSVAAFSVRHLMVTNVRGELGKVSGTINLDDKDITKSTVEATIEVAAINTRDAKRDEHLRSPDFFDVAKFPNITFKSTKVEKAGAGLKVTGTLTIRGVSKEVALSVDGPAPAVKDPWGNTKSGFTATVKLNRKDFGVQWNKSLDGGGVVVSDDVNVTIDLEVLKKK
jgi:polyisoprenoid-binding protein YceI